MSREDGWFEVLASVYFPPFQYQFGPSELREKDKVVRIKDQILNRDIDLVAKHILAEAARDVERGDCPDIGVNDWALVTERLAELAPWPDFFWVEAYERLAARAKQDEANTVSPKRGYCWSCNPEGFRKP